MITTRGRPAVFLDRDGVLNEAFVRDGVPTPPRTQAEFRVLPGVAEACSGLRQAGFVLVVVTNQPDIPNGITPLAGSTRLFHSGWRVRPVRHLTSHSHASVPAIARASVNQEKLCT